MKQCIKRISVLVSLLLAAPQVTFSQYFQRLYEVDSGGWGWNIILQPDSSYYVFGLFFNYLHNQEFNFLHLSANGAVLRTSTLSHDSSFLTRGFPGQILPLPGSGYISPLNILSFNTARTNSYSAAGMIKYNDAGDIVLFKTYVDSPHYDFVTACGIMSDGGNILSGARSFDTSSNFPGYIIRTDSMGDTLWTHTYQKNVNQWAIINNVLPLPDGRIVAGGVTTDWEYAGPPCSYRL